MLRIYDQNVDPKEAMRSFIQNGIAIFKCNRTHFDLMTYKLSELINDYCGIEPFYGFKYVPEHGFLYYIYNYKEFRSKTDQLDNLIAHADAI